MKKKHTIKYNKLKFNKLKLKDLKTFERDIRRKKLLNIYED